MGDINREYYRSKQEEQKWKTERDPVKTLSDWLVREGHVELALLTSIDAELKSEMQKAADFAVAAPYPSPDEVDEDVYA